MKSYFDGTFDANDLKLIISNHESLARKNVRIIEGFGNFRNCCENFFNNDSGNNISFNLYIQGKEKAAHKSCIFFVRDGEEKIVFICDSTDAPIEGFIGGGSLRKECTELSLMLNQGAINKIYFNRFKRLGSENGCGGFALRDLIYYTNLEDFPSWLREINVSDSIDNKIIRYELPFELMTSSHYVNLRPFFDYSIPKYVERNRSLLTTEQISILENIESPNKENDIFVENMFSLLKDLKIQAKNATLSPRETTPLLQKSKNKEGSCIEDCCVIS